MVGLKQDLEAMAKILDASGRYRVLRRLQSRTTIAEPDNSEKRLGLFVDIETTGLDPSQDEIIELAMVPFTYSLDGRYLISKSPLNASGNLSGPSHQT